MKRRQFLKICSGSLVVFAGSRIGHLSFAADSAARPDHLLVVLFLRGGCDGLNLVAPANDPSYIAARPEDLRLTDKGKYEGLSLKNGYAGVDMRLHPKAGALRELYDAGDLAIIHGCGLTSGTRSHFEAQQMMERGGADQKSSGKGSGWLTRTIESLQPGGLLPAVAIGGEVPDSLMHSRVAVSMHQARQFGYGSEDHVALLKRLYRGHESIHRVGRLTLDTVTALQSRLPRDKNGRVLDYQPEANISYEDTGDLGENLQTIAQLAKMDTGLRVATVDYDGWDTHEYQEGKFANLTDKMSRAVMAFYNDMSRFHQQMTLVVHSEFGRRLKSNQSGGTDHGHGGVNMVFGGGIKGGKIYGDWKGLANEHLDQGADLAVTTDYRSVLHEVLNKRIGIADTRTIFPGFEPSSALGFA
jgi:uncharacterized protein (DUF1501 family)